MVGESPNTVAQREHLPTTKVHDAGTRWHVRRSLWPSNATTARRFTIDTNRSIQRGKLSSSWTDLSTEWAPIHPPQQTKVRIGITRLVTTTRVAARDPKPSVFQSCVHHTRGRDSDSNSDPTRLAVALLTRHDSCVEFAFRTKD